MGISDEMGPKLQWTWALSLSKLDVPVMMTLPGNQGARNWQSIL